VRVKIKPGFRDEITTAFFVVQAGSAKRGATPLSNKTNYPLPSKGEGRVRVKNSL
jgi:hypothetical protein